jgi:hypothetical protein
MEYLLPLSTQPLFRLLGAVIVLAITHVHPVWGIAAFIVWLVWIYAGRLSPAYQKPTA